MIALRALLTVVALVGIVLPIGGAVDAPPLALSPQKTIALSFDDIPRAPGAFYTREERTERLIAALRASGVEQAAFFVNPGRVGVKDGSVEMIKA